jgi:hypothetical protein
MRCSRALGSLMYSGALLVPLLAAADSQLQGGTRRPLSASAHVSFRIVIPQVLSLDVAESTRAARQTVAVMSNNHNVALAATVGSSASTHGHLILNSAARKIIAQDAPCTLGVPENAPGFSGADAGAGDLDSNWVICTVSMP